ncbi:hypothetical protein GF324_09105 [bacterium]|nr:hypothetical protein [bacterium]
MWSPNKAWSNPAPAVEQIPVADVDRAWDVVVIGAGPSGSIAAGLLGRSGARTLLLEMDRFPREKCCGDGLTPDTVKFLQAIDAWPALQPHVFRHDTLKLRGAYGAELDAVMPVHSCRRAVTDAALAGWAVDGGARFVQGKAAGVTRLQDRRYRIDLFDRDEPLVARYVVLAGGCRTNLAIEYGLQEYRPSAMVALRGYVRTDRTIPFYISLIDAVQPGYGWVFPLGNGLHNIGVGFALNGRKTPGMSLRQAFGAFTSEDTIARSVTQNGEMVGARGTSWIRAGMPLSLEKANGGLLAVGEAIAATTRIDGEGVGRAVLSGRVAAEILTEALRVGNPDPALRYRKALASAMEPSYRIWHGLSYVMEHSRLVDRLIRLYKGVGLPKLIRYLYRGM